MGVPLVLNHLSRVIWSAKNDLGGGSAGLVARGGRAGREQPSEGVLSTQRFRAS